MTGSRSVEEGSLVRCPCRRRCRAAGQWPGWSRRCCWCRPRQSVGTRRWGPASWTAPPPRQPGRRRGCWRRCWAAGSAAAAAPGRPSSAGQAPGAARRQRPCQTTATTTSLQPRPELRVDRHLRLVYPRELFDWHTIANYCK